ncbi:MAG: hypothetical protein R3F36_15430 [Candidatus Competibacteraceae bacterium]
MAHQALGAAWASCRVVTTGGSRCRAPSPAARSGGSGPSGHERRGPDTGGAALEPERRAAKRPGTSMHSQRHPLGDLGHPGVLAGRWNRCPEWTPEPPPCPEWTLEPPPS